MKKLKMTTQKLTFEEGCNKYLEYCRQRNLRDGTIRHYRQSYLHFYKYFNPQMPIEDIDEATYKDYVLHLKATLHSMCWISSMGRKELRCRKAVKAVSVKNISKLLKHYIIYDIM